MRLDAALALRNGIQDLCHPMTDIVAYNVFHEQTRQQNTDHRIKQIQVVHPAYIEIAGKKMLYQMDQLFQDDRRRSRTDTDQKTDHQNKMLFFYMLVPP